MERSFFDKHHIIPKSKWWSNNNWNLVKMPRSEHQALHRLFWTSLPHEQLLKLLQINHWALQRKVVMQITESVYDNLSWWDQYFYKDWVWRK